MVNAYLRHGPPPSQIQHLNAACLLVNRFLRIVVTAESLARKPSVAQVAVQAYTLFTS